jgi:hypothetical protein
VIGKVYAADYAVPAPAVLTTAVENMLTAYTDAAGRAPDFVELYSGNIAGKTLAPGTYKWGTGVVIPTDVTLDGGPNDTWIFQVAQDVTVSDSAQVLLIGGAKAKNIVWVVAGAMSMGVSSHFEGVILCKTAITLNTNASVNGRLLAQTAVTLISNVVSQP